jgi:hypothetical protein
MEDVGVLFGHLVNFMVFWLSGIGKPVLVFCTRKKSGNPGPPFKKTRVAANSRLWKSSRLFNGGASTNFAPAVGANLKLL